MANVYITWIEPGTGERMTYASIPSSATQEALERAVKDVRESIRVAHGDERAATVKIGH